MSHRSHHQVPTNDHNRQEDFGDYRLLIGERDPDAYPGTGRMDIAFGRGGSDYLAGRGQDDDLQGGKGNDVLLGGAGMDHLDGGKGNDELNGGDGADAFIVGPDTGNDVVTGGFDAGPGAFDHIAFRDILPSQVTVADVVSAHDDGHTGVLVSWQTDQGNGSIFLEGLTKSQMAQDDFMFNADDGRAGAFVKDPSITSVGSQLIFQ